MVAMHFFCLIIYGTSNLNRFIKCYRRVLFLSLTHFTAVSTIIHKNNETNEKFYWKVTFLMYTEMVNFRPES